MGSKGLTAKIPKFFISVCLIVCILTATEDLFPEWFYSQKDILFFFCHFEY